MKKRVFVSFLMPFPIRGVEAPFLWVFLKQLHHFSADQVVFIGAKSYVDLLHRQPQDRVEFNEASGLHYGYAIPKKRKKLQHHFVFFDTAVLDEISTLHHGNSNEIYAHLLTKTDTTVVEHCTSLLMTLHETYDLQGVITWCNMPSLSKAAESLGLAVIHNELGALRSPLYHPTAYFDFSGVNGNTQSKERFTSFDQMFTDEECLSLEEIRNLMIVSAYELHRYDGYQYDAGIALQVEDDSNLLAFSNGYDALSLISRIKQMYSDQKICIREHPNGHFRYDKLGEIDISKNALEFLSKCRALATINSSVALEALLLEKTVHVFGDSPFAFAVKLEESARLKAINFSVFAYLIPYAYLFDYDYYMWRITFPSEKEIYFRHLNFYKELLQDVSQTHCAKVFADEKMEPPAIQLFVDSGKGFQEAHSIKYPLDKRKALHRFTFNLDKPDITQLRLDPINDSCVVEILSIELFSQSGTQALLTETLHSNALIADGLRYYFQTHDPQFVIPCNFKNPTSLNVEIRYVAIGRYALNTALSFTKEQVHHVQKEHQKALQAKEQELNQTKHALHVKSQEAEENQKALQAKEQELNQTKHA
ncbi:MAG: hypothetical protein JXK05_04935, partial [Campylobacterales bacterium]|nr:hypothetical protein [Campylobacterales bacterium]